MSNASRPLPTGILLITSIVSFMREHVADAKDRGLYRRMVKEVGKARELCFTPSAVDDCIKFIYEHRNSIATADYQTAVFVLEAELHKFSGRYQMAFSMVAFALDDMASRGVQDPSAYQIAVQCHISCMAAGLIERFPTFETLSTAELTELTQTLNSFDGLVAAHRARFDATTDEGRELAKETLAVVLCSAAKVSFHMGDLGSASSLLIEAEALHHGIMHEECKITALAETHLLAPWRQFVAGQLFAVDLPGHIDHHEPLTDREIKEYLM